MVEALVTLLVLSIGLLGVAALQLNSLRANHSASLRSQATFLAYEIVDKMRANRSAALVANAYVTELGAAAPSCTTVARCDLADWRARLASLPAGDGAIERLAGPELFRITVEWDDTRGDAVQTTGMTVLPPARLRFVMETRL
jgi:type IV pilus assembly protein PilV